MLTRIKNSIHSFSLSSASRLLVICLIISIIMLNGCSDEPNGPQLTGMTMGTSYSIQWHSETDNFDIETIKQTIDARLEHINALMSTYIPNSQLSEFNQSRDTGWHAVDEELAKLVAEALQLCAQSDGAFDVTVGPLVNLWGFGADDSQFKFPNSTEINTAMRSTGCQHLEARLSPPAINKKLTDLYVDLSAIAKGYAVDALANILDKHKIENYMVEIGGEIKAKGIAAHGDPWRIGIETPATQRGDIQEIISLADIAVATSGDYRNYFEHEGQRYSHTIDPRTGYPVKHSLASVTILHPSTSHADAWATAFMVLGAQESINVAKQLGISGLLITRHGEQYKTTLFGNMSTYLSH